MSDYDPDDDYTPGAFLTGLVCECGRRYEGYAVVADASYDSPGWNEPEPGHEKCPTCREREELEAGIVRAVRAWCDETTHYRCEG